jgi:hypothetical protein
MSLLNSTVDNCMEKFLNSRDIIIDALRLKDESKRCPNSSRSKFHINRFKLFYSGVPNVKKFTRKFVESKRIENLKELANANIDKLKIVWENKGSGSLLKN